MKDTNEVKRSVMPKSAKSSSRIPQYPASNGTGTFQKATTSTSMKPSQSRIPQFPASNGTGKYQKAMQSSMKPSNCTIPQFGMGGKNMMGSRGTDK